jgi:hypothetical protein
MVINSVSAEMRGYLEGFLGGRPLPEELPFSLPEALEGVYDHGGKAAHHGGYSASRKTGLGKIYTRYDTAAAKHEGKYLPYDGNNQIGKRNSVFGFNIGGVMSFRSSISGSGRGPE